MPTKLNDDFIFQHEAAKIAGVTVATLARWRQERRGPKYHLASKTRDHFSRPMYLRGDMERLRMAREIMAEMKLLPGQRYPERRKGGSRYFLPRRKAGRSSVGVHPVRSVSPAKTNLKRRKAK